MTREEHIYQLIQYLQGRLISMCPASSLYWQEHWEEVIKALEQEPQTFKWCTDCKEYDQEKHCCHRWSKAIRDTVEEMKQEYIEREVLDKVRAEIEVYTDPQGFITISEGRFNSILDKYKAETEAEDGNVD